MNVTDRKILGDKLRELRLKNNLTLEEVGKKIGKSFKSVQLYETGNTTISLDVFFSLCAIYGVKPGEIIDSIF